MVLWTVAVCIELLPFVSVTSRNVSDQSYFLAFSGECLGKIDVASGLVIVIFLEDFVRQISL